MKLNVDLTLNSDFIKRDTDVHSSRLTIHSLPIIFGVRKKVSLSKYIKKNIVDIDYCLEQDIEKSKGVLIQGNGERRKFYKEINNPENYCERCGRKNKIPWKKYTNLLCEECNKDMEERNIIKGAI